MSLLSKMSPTYLSTLYIIMIVNVGIIFDFSLGVRDEEEVLGKGIYLCDEHEYLFLGHGRFLCIYDDI
jgi:hypothetical protein